MGRAAWRCLWATYLPFACNRAWPLDHCDVPEWRDWFGCLSLAILRGSMNIDTSWDEINHGPEINSWRCVSLIPGSHWVHVIPAFFHLICPPDLPEMDIFMFSFHMMLFSPLFLWKRGCKLSVILGQKTICDRMWLQMIDCFFLLIQIYEFNIII